MASLRHLNDMENSLAQKVERGASSASASTNVLGGLLTFLIMITLWTCRQISTGSWRYSSGGDSYLAAVQKYGGRTVAEELHELSEDQLLAVDPDEVEILPFDSTEDALSATNPDDHVASSETDDMAEGIAKDDHVVSSETDDMAEGIAKEGLKSIAKIRPSSDPHLVRLRRESVPIYRRGKIASFKTSYSGILRVGLPAQDFRVVFDTGSGNVVIPAVECQSESCLVHRRFNTSASKSAIPVNSDGSLVPLGELGEQVTIGFGTGEITGEFVKDNICIVSGEGNLEEQSEEALALDAKKRASEGPCLEMSVIVAVQMSTQPFKTFHFDGILGLGLGALAMARDFSVFGLLSTRLGAPQFGAFLTEGEDGEESEMAFGGHNPARLLEPLSWTPVAMPELGYWQIEILAVRINGVELDVCMDGTCRGVVDTGTSHLGIPAPHDVEFNELLTRSAEDLLDCRLVEAPEVTIELRGYNLTLGAANYMRRLPLREGVTVSSSKGVHLEADATAPNATAPNETTPSVQDETTAADTAPSETTSSVQNDTVAAANETVNQSGAGTATAQEIHPHADTADSETKSVPTMPLAEASTLEEPEEIRRFCRPRTMPVRLPPPLGPKLFILGEPVLHRYYTVYDWKARSVGFGLSNSRRNTMDPSEITDRRGVLPKEVDMLLMQQRMASSRGGRASSASDAGGLEEDDVIMFQVHISVAVVPKRVLRIAG